MHKKNRLAMIVTMALLIAIEVVRTRFLSFNTQFLRIGFGFLPVAVMGMMYGPLWAGIGYAVGDVLGMLIFPSGPYFPGFTVSAFLTGLVYGFLFYKKEVTWQRALAASLIISVAVNLGLDTLWLSMLYGQGYIAILVGRLVKFPLAVAIQTVLVPLVYRLIVKRLPSAIRS